MSLVDSARLPVLMAIMEYDLGRNEGNWLNVSVQHSCMGWDGSEWSSLNSWSWARRVDGLEDGPEEWCTLEFYAGGPGDIATAVVCLLSCADHSMRDTLEGSRLSYRTPYSLHSNGAQEVGAVEPVPELKKGQTEELWEDGSDDWDNTMEEGLIQLNDAGEWG